MQQYTYGLHVFNISKNKIIPFGLKIVHEAGVKKKKKKTPQKVNGCDNFLHSPSCMSFCAIKIYSTNPKEEI
jgi:hypothetical protein